MRPKKSLPPPALLAQVPKPKTQIPGNIQIQITKTIVADGSKPRDLEDCFKERRFTYVFPDNSPAFQRWVPMTGKSKVPSGDDRTVSYSSGQSVDRMLLSSLKR